MADRKLIAFPRERVRACLNPPEAPCLILVLPVVRIERDDDPPLLGRRQTRRCRNAINKLRGARARQMIVDDLT